MNVKLIMVVVIKIAQIHLVVINVVALKGICTITPQTYAMVRDPSLRKICQNTGFLWTVFSRIRTDIKWSNTFKQIYWLLLTNCLSVSDHSVSVLKRQSTGQRKFVFIIFQINFAI